MKTYDVVFNDSTGSDSKGFAATLKYCKAYIQTWNGSDNSYFADYKGGEVSIVCNETNKKVYIKTVK